LAPVTTNATTNTGTDAVFVKPGTGAKVTINGLRLQGMASAGTTLNGMIAYFKNFTTASTGGTSMTPAPTSISGAVAAQATAAGAPTAGSGGATIKGGFGCSGSGPSFWTPPTSDQAVDAPAGYAGSIDLFSAAVAVSLPYHWYLDFLE